jgi:integrase
VPAKVVSERLGHATISITLDTYTHVLPEQDAEAAESVASLILGEGGPEGSRAPTVHQTHPEVDADSPRPEL